MMLTRSPRYSFTSILHSYLLLSGECLLSSAVSLRLTCYSHFYPKPQVFDTFPALLELPHLKPFRSLLLSGAICKSTHLTYLHILMLSLRRCQLASIILEVPLSRPTHENPIWRTCYVHVVPVKSEERLDWSAFGRDAGEVPGAWVHAWTAWYVSSLFMSCEELLMLCEQSTLS